jgi:adenylosuccinate lyase
MYNKEQLKAISPIDGRYRNKTEDLAFYFSEFGLIRYRVMVEIEYFIELCEIKIKQLINIKVNIFDQLRNIYKNFSFEDAVKVKKIEAITNHDVKAVEYFLKEKFDTLGLGQYKEFIHFGLTSQDINNTATPISIKDAIENVYYHALNELVAILDKMTEKWKNVAMLSKTHGQPASPTRLGKEIKVFSERIKNQLKALKQVPFSGKFGGATGNFNAHHVAYPEIDWINFGNNFLRDKLHIEREQFTTQISNYDNLAAIFDNLKRINTVMIDLSRDFWTYIMMEYFKQTIKSNEVGSSAMPHKVNPIDFENAEGNIGIANAIFEHLSSKLPVSRLQRDLTDSTVLRNMGVPIAHSVLAIKSLLTGLKKLELNKNAIDNDLEKNYVVVAEGIQTILRREGYPEPYEALKKLTRTNKIINSEIISQFIDGLNVSDYVKQELKSITPFSYTGM